MAAVQYANRLHHVSHVMLAFFNHSVNQAMLEKWGEDPDRDLRRWSDLEEAIMMHYFAIYNDRVCAAH